MEHVLYRDEGDERYALYLGKKHRIVHGITDYTGYDTKKFKALLAEGMPKWYFKALVNTLVAQRGAVSVNGHMLLPLKNWPLSVPETTAMICQERYILTRMCVDTEIIYEKSVLHVTMPAKEEPPVLQKRTGILVDLETVIDKEDPEIQTRVRTKVCPLITIALRTLMCLENRHIKIRAYSDTFNAWEYVSRYISNRLICVNQFSHDNEMFDLTNHYVSFDQYVNSLSGEYAFLILTHMYHDLAQLLYNSRAKGIIIVTQVDLDDVYSMQKYKWGKYNYYIKDVPLNISKMHLGRNRGFIYTDFYRDSEVYRIHDDRSREMMRSHMCFASNVRVSGDLRMIQGFYNREPSSSSDVGFVTSTFYSGLKGYVSLEDGRYRVSRYAALSPTMHVIEGTFIHVLKDDRCSMLYDENDNPYVYARSSCSVIRKRRSDVGVILSVRKYRIYVYSHKVLLGGDADYWYKRDYHKCASYRIGKG